MQGMPNARPTNQMAIVSLVCGIASWVIFPVFGAVAAIVCGYMARREIAASGGMQDGAQYATFGIILGWVHIAVTCLSFIAVFALFGAGILAALGLAATGAAQH